MGFDVSYHPISELEIQKWYFNVLNDNAKIDILAAEYGINDFYKEKYANVIETGRTANPEEVFDKTHAFYIAVVQGFFRTFYYTRGCALTFLIEEKPEYRRYTKQWSEILGREPGGTVYNKIIENYCGGVYIPEEQVKQILSDYEQIEAVKQDLDTVFAYGNISVFLKALNFAKENNLGILEATEVVEPNPVDLNKSSCFSNLFNCDKDGALIYRDIAEKQFAAAVATTPNREEPVTVAYEIQQDSGNKKDFFNKIKGLFR